MTNPYTAYADQTERQRGEFPNPSEAVADFVAAMEAAGIHATEPISHRLLSGQPVRFSCEGDKQGKRSAWAILHLDGCPAGVFRWYKAGIRETWRADRVIPMSAVERRAWRAQIRLQQEQRQREREALHLATAQRAEAICARANSADPAHPYLVRKRIGPEGFLQIGDKLIVPVHDIDGKVWNRQQIDAAGDKLFLKGGRVDGLMFRIGEPGTVICIGEGAATVAAVRRATGHAVVAAFSAGNLEPVARAVASSWPDSDIIILADDDRHLVDHPHVRRNIGLDAAHAAALAVGGRVAVPGEGNNND